MQFLWVELMEAWKPCRVTRENFCYVEFLDPWVTVNGRSLVCRIVSMHEMNLVFEVFLEVIIVEELILCRMAGNLLNCMLKHCIRVETLVEFED